MQTTLLTWKSQCLLFGERVGYFLYTELMLKFSNFVLAHLIIFLKNITVIIASLHVQVLEIIALLTKD